MRQDVVERFHAEIRTLIRKLNEDEMDRYAVINGMQETADKIEKMIQELGRLMGEGLMQLKATATVSMGGEAAEMADTNLTEPLNNAADALTQLLAAVTRTMEALESGDMSGGMGADMGMDAMGADMGMEPGMEPDMGAEPLPGEEGDVAADMSDVELGSGDEGERLKKEM